MRLVYEAAGSPRSGSPPALRPPASPTDSSRPLCPCPCLCPKASRRRRTTSQRCLKHYLVSAQHNSCVQCTYQWATPPVEPVTSAATASPPQRLLDSAPRPLQRPLSNPRLRRPLSSTSSTSFPSGPSDSARPRNPLCGRECISGTSGRRCRIHNRADSSCPCSDRTIKQLHQYSKSTYRTRDLPCPSPLA